MHINNDPCDTCRYVNIYSFFTHDDRTFHYVKISRNYVEIRSRYQLKVMEIKTRIKYDFHVMFWKNGIAFIRVDVRTQATQSTSVSSLLLISSASHAHRHRHRQTVTYTVSQKKRHKTHNKNSVKS